ncbi:unnamed protein product, partial [Medioppia subpectinata]
NQSVVPVPRELGRNTRFVVTSDDIESLNVTLKAPDNRVYGLGGDRAVYRPLEMRAAFAIPMADEGKWTVGYERRQRDNNYETVIAYLSVTSESRVDEPVKVRAWVDTPFTATGKGADHKVTTTAVITAEVTKRYNYVICADVLALVDRPTGDPVVIRLRDNGLGADKVANDGLYSGVFRQFNGNGRYGVSARVVDNGKPMIKLGIEDRKVKCGVGVSSLFVGTNQELLAPWPPKNNYIKQIVGDNMAIKLTCMALLVTAIVIVALMPTNQSEVSKAPGSTVQEQRDQRARATIIYITGGWYKQVRPILCRGGCQEPVCDSPGYKGRDLALDRYSQLSASTSMFVFEPTDDSLVIFEIVEQEPDETVDDYDPYRADWTAPNSRYGSRNSLNKGYPEGTLKSNKSQPKSYHLGYDNDDNAPDQHN